ncbi:MAG: hypothetical protein WCS80_00740 [Bacilli bacterium]
MFGKLYPKSSRSIYALVDGYEDEELIWESSDSTIVSVSSLYENDTKEGYLIAKTLGTVTITCTLADHPKLKTSLTIVVENGKTIDEDIYNRFLGGMRVDGKAKYYNYDSALVSSLDSSETYETVYEEKNGEPSDSNHTDCYEIEITDDESGNNIYSKRSVKSTGSYVGVEYLDYMNEIQVEKQANEDDESIKFDSSYYSNLFNSENVSYTDFATFDNGKTYQYVGGSYLTMTYLAASLTLSDISPDEFYLSVDGNTYGLGFKVDPVKETETSLNRYGMAYSGTLSDIGTATIDHLKPFSHETYHDTIKAAQEKMSKNSNYKMSYTLDYPETENDVTYSFVFTPETIDQTVTDSNGAIVSHTGSHKKDESSYYNYTYDDKSLETTIVKTIDDAWTLVNRYPTFDFAPEIFADSKDGVYTSKNNSGALLRYAMFMPSASSIFDFDAPVSMTINDDHITSLSTEADVLGDTVSIKAVFTDFDSAVCAIDFSQAISSQKPTSWDEDESIVKNSMTEWGIKDAVPYLYCSVGWNGTIGWVRSANPLYAQMKTEEFENAADCTAFIDSYKQCLLDNGFVLSATAVDNKGNYLYEKDGWGISVANDLSWNGSVLNKMTIKVYGDGLTNPNV